MLSRWFSKAVKCFHHTEFDGEEWTTTQRTTPDQAMETLGWTRGSDLETSFVNHPCSLGMESSRTTDGWSSCCCTLRGTRRRAHARESTTHGYLLNKGPINLKDKGLTKFAKSDDEYKNENYRSVPCLLRGEKSNRKVDVDVPGPHEYTRNRWRLHPKTWSICLLI